MTAISALTALTGAGVDGAADLFPIVDMSAAGAARNKKITINEAKIAFGLAGTNSGDQTITLTGDVTGTGTGSFAATIANNAVSFAKFVAAPSEGLVWATGAGNYAHNASGGGTTNFLRADGTWAAPPGSGGFTAASTTEVLTGTDSAKGGTPDSIAALWEQGSDVASAGTISIGEGGYFNITGTTTITDIDFGTDKAGRKVWVKFAGVLTLTHNASTLILPTGASITTAAGDTACFVSEGSDAVRCVSYNRADGSALVGGGSGDYIFIGRTVVTTLSAVDIALSDTYDSFHIEFYFTPSNDGIGLDAAVSDDNFATVEAGATDYHYSRITHAATSTGVVSSNGTTIISILATASIGNAASEYSAGTIEIINAKETAPTHIRADLNYVTAAAAFGGARTIAGFKPTQSINGLRITPTAGTVTGFYKIWGRAV